MPHNHDLRILDEDQLDIDGAARLIGAHFTTMFRKMTRGDRTPGGGRAYLGHLHTGGKIMTSRQAIERHLVAINGINLDAPGVVEASPAHSKRRQAELARVDRELQEARI